MPSLLGEGVEDMSGEHTLPRVKYRPSVRENEHSVHTGKSFDSSKCDKAAPPVALVAPTDPDLPATRDGFSIKHEIFKYAMSCRDGTAKFEELRHLVEAWAEHIHRPNEGSQPGAGFFGDFTACVQCQCLLYDPITISCGHTYCKACLSKLLAKTCIKCNQAWQHSNWATFKTNVVIADLLSKWWPAEQSTVQLKQEGNRLFLENQVDKAIEKYTQAYSIASNRDHLLASNLSHAHLQIGQALQALQYAEATIKLRPDWPKGYCRKGLSLLSLGRYEDAAVAFLMCLGLESQLPSVVMEFTKVLHRIICTFCGISKPHLVSGKHKDSDATGVAGIFKQRLLFWSYDNVLGKSPDEEGDASVYATSSKRKRHKGQLLPLDGIERLYRFLDRCQASLDLLKKIEMKKVERLVDPNLLDKIDFECTLCLRTFWQPVTTPCGHVFCRMCLDRCLDHMPRCPLCKSSLEDYLAERRQSVTEFIEIAMQTYIPEIYAERRQSHQEEMSDLTKDAEGSKREMPIFVCTVSFPTVPCPLHVFEPRYRLMVRRCLESGSRLFGMCIPQEGSPDSFSDYGTTLEIRDVQYFPDGRAVVDTVGRERFRVLERGMKDGYHVATVEFLKDRPNDDDETRRLHDAVHSEVLRWFGELSAPIKNRILGHFGPMPETETEYGRSARGPAWVWWTLAILPLDARAQLAILSMTSLQKRLEALHRAVTFMIKKPS